MRSTFSTKEDAADACWRVINSPDPNLIPCKVLHQIELPEKPDMAQTEATVRKIIEIAWKRGFMDAMLAIESDALITVPVENN